MRLLSKGRSAIVAGMAVLAIGSVACGNDASSTAAGAGSSTQPAMTSPTDTGMMSDQPFGAACSEVPADGEGSFDGMSTLVTAVTAAYLGDTLNGADDITVFAPIDDAFAAVPKKTLKTVMADPKGLLTKVLTYHVVQGRLSPADLAGTHDTLEGSALEVTGSGESFMVNGTANVVCGNVQTANATVYLIDGVLTPPDM
jgi:uncharacterized surface protein with fasciclin (FAS1) repeats